MKLSETLENDLIDAGLMVKSIKWHNMTDGNRGACIPISFAIQEFLALRGRPSRVAESKLTARDPFNVQYMEIQPYENGFLGHAVTLMPAVGLLIDGSLWMQPSKVLSNFKLPPIILADWRKGIPSYRKIGRLALKWEPDLTADEWKRRSWPWDEIRRVVGIVEKEYR